MSRTTSLPRRRLGRTRAATALAAAGALIMSAGLVLVATTAAQADEHDEPCVPQDAWTETIQHPAVTHTEQRMTDPGQEYRAPVEAAEGHWENLNWFVWRGGPRETAPGIDEDGWGDPPALPAGLPHAPTPQMVYNVSNNDTGLGSWFKYDGNWVEGTPFIPGQQYIPPSFTTVTIVDQEAWTETINHPAVTCEPETETTDVCPNIEGDQAEVPEGYTLEGGVCAEILGEETIVPKPKPDKKPTKATDEPTVRGVQAVAPPAAAPTAVAAGLGAPASSPLQTIAQMLVAGGMLLLMGGAWIGLGRREYGSHEA